LNIDGVKTEKRRHGVYCRAFLFNSGKDYLLSFFPDNTRTMVMTPHNATTPKATHNHQEWSGVGLAPPVVVPVKTVLIGIADVDAAVVVTAFTTGVVVEANGVKVD